MTLSIKDKLITKEVREALTYGGRMPWQKRACNHRHKYDYFVHNDTPYLYRRISILQDETVHMWRRYVIEECRNSVNEEPKWELVPSSHARGYDYSMHSEWRKIVDEDLFKNILKND